MTPPVNDADAVRRLLRTAEALLLDFDGPICSVFAGFPAPVVADQLRDILIEGGHDVPANVRESEDPFDVLFHAVKLGANEARFLEAAFQAHEVEAVQSAEPTEGAHELIRAWKATGRPLAIVSNNSVAAVETYLDLHELRSTVDMISARANANISLLKPDRYLVRAATHRLRVDESKSVFVGDSTTDVEAAHAAGVSVIAYANKPGKLQRFVAVEATTIITSIMQLAMAMN